MKLYKINFIALQMKLKVNVGGLQSQEEVKEGAVTILFHLLSHKQQVEVTEVFVSSVNQGYRPLLLLNVMPTDKDYVINHIFD